MLVDIIGHRLYGFDFRFSIFWREIWANLRQILDAPRRLVEVWRGEFCFAAALLEVLSLCRPQRFRSNALRIS